MTELPQARSNWPRATLTQELEKFIDELVKPDLQWLEAHPDALAFPDAEALQGWLGNLDSNQD